MPERRPSQPERVLGTPDGGDDVGPGMVGELGGQRADRPHGPVHQHGRPIHRAVAEDGTVGSDPRNAEACPEKVIDLVRQIDRLVGGHHGVLGGGAERPI